MSMKFNWPRLVLAFFLTMQVGMSDASLGALLTSLQQHYSLSYSTVSFIFLVNVAGWSLSTPSVPFLLHHLGMRTTLIFAAILNLISGVTMVFTPPFGAVISSILLFGIGAGVIDAALSTYTARLGLGKMMSILYAFISVGAFVSPLIIAGILGSGARWSMYYFVPIGTSAASLVPIWFLFGDYTEPNEEKENVDGEKVSVGERYKMSLTSWVVIVGGILATLSLATAEILSGWIVSYMVTVRHGLEVRMQYILSGFWAGQALGRLLLPLLPLPQKRLVPLYLILVFGLLSVVQFVPNIIGSAIATAFAGMFLGPVSPTVLSVVSDLVPKPLLSPTVSILTTVGLVGSALGPLLMGFANGAGALPYLPAVLMGMTGVLLMVWGVAQLVWRKDTTEEETVIGESGSEMAQWQA